MCNYMPFSVPTMWNLAKNELDLPTSSSEYKAVKTTIDSIHALAEVLADYLESVPMSADSGNNPSDHDNASGPAKISAASEFLDEQGKVVMFSLLGNVPNMTFSQIFKKVGPSLQDTIRYCHNDKKECHDILPTHSVLFPTCFEYNTLGDRPGPTVFDEGLGNGALEMVFLTGVQFAPVAVDKHSLIPPSFHNTYSPFSSNGIRMLITSPDVRPSIDKQGLDISPAQSTLIAITAKETIRLSWPYSDCSDSDYELNQLRESVVQRLGYTPEISIKDETYTYAQQDCRSSCVQNYIWLKCQCLSLEETLPFENIEGHLMCGALAKSDMAVFLELTKHNKESCIRNATELLSEKCTFLHKLIYDSECLMKAKTELDDLKFDGKLSCTCPSPCHSYDYEVSITQTPWPSKGFEMYTAYSKLVVESAWNYVFDTDQTGNISCSDGSGEEQGGLNDGQVLSRMSRSVGGSGGSGDGSDGSAGGSGWSQSASGFSGGSQYGSGNDNISGDAQSESENGSGASGVSQDGSGHDEGSGGGTSSGSGNNPDDSQSGSGEIQNDSGESGGETTTLNLRLGS